MHQILDEIDLIERSDNGQSRVSHLGKRQQIKGGRVQL